MYVLLHVHIQLGCTFPRYLVKLLLLLYPFLVEVLSARDIFGVVVT
jgi:hypothetical protein